MYALNLAELVLTFYGGKSVVKDIDCTNSIGVSHVITFSGMGDFPSIGKTSPLDVGEAYWKLGKIPPPLYCSCA